jgi:hypothetical protein
MPGTIPVEERWQHRESAVCAADQEALFDERKSADLKTKADAGAQQLLGLLPL